MGRKLNYKVETKVQRLPKDLKKLFEEISTAYGNSEDKEKFIDEKYDTFKTRTREPEAINRNEQAKELRSCSTCKHDLSFTPRCANCDDDYKMYERND